ncbi:MAG: heterocycloanthracin/sonorensin family bacteriocin, partial [Planctomycetaceae bacterium]|nr:heterocycloanthracin/sonorensin family bacteriocin [Planctomycetaceae bacterium]
EFGNWGAGAWAAPSGRYAPSDFAEEFPDDPRRSSRIRQARFQPSEAMQEQGVDPDLGNIPVPGAENEVGPITDRARRYLQHSLMYDDAAQVNAREKTVTGFNPGYPTNTNNEFGDFGFGPPVNGPLLEKAGPHGYGPSHDACYGSGRCGRDMLCCDRPGGCGRAGCGELGTCGGCGTESCGSCGGRSYGWWETLTVAGGVQGFKSPIDLGRNGNFGFREGINWGTPLSMNRGIGGQIGLNALQSDLSGNTVAGPSSSARNQIFVTAGLFRRALPGERWQGGIAYDFLYDDYYVTLDQQKLRGELSFVARNRDELGVWVSASLGSDSVFSSLIGNTVTDWTTNDLYAAFWRRTLQNGTVGRAWAGATGNGDGMLGGEISIPFTDRWALEANVNYLIPGSNSGATGSGTQEAWNVAIGITWYPGGNAYCAAFNPFRPLFNVADNALFPYLQK